MLIYFDEQTSSDEFIVANSSEDMEDFVEKNKAVVGNNVIAAQPLEYTKIKFIDGGACHYNVKQNHMAGSLPKAQSRTMVKWNAEGTIQ